MPKSENTWEENAENVAQAATALVRRVDARLLVLAGDVRAVSMLHDALPGDLAAHVETVSFERPWEGSGGTSPTRCPGSCARSWSAKPSRFWRASGRSAVRAISPPTALAATTAALISGEVAVLLVQEGVA